MDEEELLGKMLYVARESARRLLEEQNAVPPFSATLDASGDDPHVFSPVDTHSTAESEELFTMAVADFAERAASGSIAVGAVVTTLESDQGSALGIQLETRESALFLLYPYEKGPSGWMLRDAQQADGLLLGPVWPE